METKKVIEQESTYGKITVTDLNDPIEVHQLKGIKHHYIHIDKSKATEVAKAICPKYQEIEDDKDVLQYILSQARKFVGAKPGESIEDKFTELKDHNAKLLEAKDKEMIDFAWWLVKNLKQYSDDRLAHFKGRYLEQWKQIQAIQQSETKSKDNE